MRTSTEKTRKGRTNGRAATPARVQRQRPQLGMQVVRVQKDINGLVGAVQDLIENKSEIKNGWNDFVDAEKGIYDAGSKQVVRAAKYLKRNWKAVVPALAVLGVSALLVSRGDFRKH